MYLTKNLKRSAVFIASLIMLAAQILPVGGFWLGTASADASTPLFPVDTVSAYNDWNGSAGFGSNNGKVTAVGSNDLDDSYIVTTGLDKEQSFEVANSDAPLGAVISSVTVHASAKKTSSDITSLSLIATNADSKQISTSYNLTEEYENYSWTMTSNPFTDTAWLQSEVTEWPVNFGLQKISEAGTVRVTEFYVTVDYTLPQQQAELKEDENTKVDEEVKDDTEETKDTEDKEEQPNSDDSKQTDEEEPKAEQQPEERNVKTVQTSVVDNDQDDKDDDGAKIYGYKFNDLNGNGQFDNNEHKLAGWTINYCEIDTSNPAAVFLGLTDCEGPIVSTTTDTDGNYEFTGVTIGDYLVCETQRDGWTRTYPAGNDCQIVYVEVKNDECEAIFGNKAKEPEVKGEVTPPPAVTPPAVLAETGSSFIQAVIVGMSIITAAGVTLAYKQSPKQQ